MSAFDYALRFCRHCEEMIPTDHPNGKPIPPRVHSVMRYCSRKCADAAPDTDTEPITCVGCGISGLTLNVYAAHSGRCPGGTSDAYEAIESVNCLVSAFYVKDAPHDREYYDGAVRETLRERERKAEFAKSLGADAVEFSPGMVGMVPHRELDETKDRHLWRFDADGNVLVGMVPYTELHETKDRHLFRFNSPEEVRAERDAETDAREAQLELTMGGIN